MEIFDEMIASLDENKKFFQLIHKKGLTKTVCMLGVDKRNYPAGSTAITSMPAQVDEIYFMDSANSELLAAFLETGYAQHISGLYIGGSSDLDSEYDVDYSDVVRILETAHLPRLRELKLGFWELFCNQYNVYGNLGDVATLLEHFPALETLSLSGDMELSRAVHLPQLQSLCFEAGGNNAYDTPHPLSQQSLEHLLGLSAALTELELNLCHDYKTINYTFPVEFLAAHSMPMLQKLEISASMSDEEYARIRASALLARPGLDHRCWRKVNKPLPGQSDYLRIVADMK